MLILIYLYVFRTQQSVRKFKNSDRVVISYRRVVIRMYNTLY